MPGTHPQHSHVCALPPPSPQFLPKRYDYGRPVPELNASTSAAAEAAECVICMGAVDLSSKAHRAVTPCSHIFHPACLEHWMVVKADCPVCRRPLPPL